jgi:acetyl-CoA C-acetyltransferase
VNAALDRAGIDPARVDDVYLGCGNHWNSQSYNLRPADRALHPNCPTRSGGLDAGPQVLVRPQRHRAGRAGIRATRLTWRCGGMESISLTINKRPSQRAQPIVLSRRDPYAYMAMIETAEIVAERYGISREAQDRSPRRASSAPVQAQAEGRFDDEIVPITVTKALFDKEGNETGKGCHLPDEGVRAARRGRRFAGCARVQGRLVSRKASTSRPAMPRSCPMAHRRKW